MSDIIRNEIDKIVDKPRSEYGRLCICDVDCEQHLDIERYLTMRKMHFVIYQNLDISGFREINLQGKYLNVLATCQI